MRCRLFVNVPIHATSFSLAPVSTEKCKIIVSPAHGSTLKSLPTSSARSGVIPSQKSVQGRSLGWEKWPTTALMDVTWVGKGQLGHPHHLAHASNSSWTSILDRCDNNPREFPHRYVILLSNTALELEASHNCKVEAAYRRPTED